MVLFAPLMDYLILPQRITFTSIITYLYLFFVIISFFAWAGRFRDENNKCSLQRFKEQANLYIYLTKARIKEIRKNNLDNQLFIIGVYIFIFGFIIKAFQNISEIFKMPFQVIGFKMKFLETFESYTLIGFFFIFIGFMIVFLLHVSQKIDIFDVFIFNTKPHSVYINVQDNYVINLKNTEQVKNLIVNNPSSIFRTTLSNLLEWKPMKMKLEDDYEFDLLKFLSMRLNQKDFKVKNQYAIKSGKEIGRVDLAINESLFIELKRKIKSSELDRAGGQILKYQRILKDSNIPLILLIVDNEYEKIRIKLTDFIKDYNNKHTQKLLAVIVEPEERK